MKNWWEVGLCKNSGKLTWELSVAGFRNLTWKPLSNQFFDFLVFIKLDIVICARLKIICEIN